MAIIKLEDLKKPLLALSDDVDRAEKEMVVNDDSYSRRNYIRALSAMIEGTIYILKRTVLLAASTGPGALSIAELALLKEESFYLDKGVPKYRKSTPRQVTIYSSLRVVLRKHSGILSISMPLLTI